MKMINKIIRAMQDTGLIDGMSAEDCDTLATAVLEGMREPSEKMKESFHNDALAWFNEEIEDEYHLYKVMIDAALNE